MYFTGSWELSIVNKNNQTAVNFNLPRKKDEKKILKKNKEYKKE